VCQGRVDLLRSSLNMDPNVVYEHVNALEKCGFRACVSGSPLHVCSRAEGPCSSRTVVIRSSFAQALQHVKTDEHVNKKVNCGELDKRPRGT